VRALVLFFGRHGLWLGLLAVAGLLASLFFIETEEGMYRMGYWAVGVPLAVLIVGLGLWYIDDLQRQCDTQGGYWCCLVAMPLVWLFASPGLFLWFCVLCPPQTPYVLHGVVTERWTTVYKRSPRLWIKVAGYSENIMVSYSDADPDSIEVGDMFSQGRVLGRFGLSYFWRGGVRPDPANYQRFTPGPTHSHPSHP
jgi:hypothetical protein